RLGDRRRVRRRQVVGGVAAVAVLAVGAGVLVAQVLGAPPSQPIAPSPAVTARPAPGPGDRLEDAEVPRLEDFEWSEGVTFDGYRASVVDDVEISRCQQAGTGSLGATDTRLVEVSSDVTAAAVVMAFPDEAAAGRAWATLQRWGEECGSTLEQEGTPPVVGPDPLDVPVPRGRAGYVSVAVDAGDEAGLWVDYGTTQVGDRVVLATFESVGQDFSWDAEPGGPVGQTYPMIRTLQNMNERLVR
uniref:hypothetical protein n=1 Tax=Desertihabitans aurantiacus TaxID=2282477 RepID=UPI0018E5040B